MMNDRSFSFDLFQRAPIVGILRGLDRDVILNLASCFESAGLTTLEITMNTPNAVEIIKELRGNYKNLNIGAGTVCNAGDLQMAIDAGSQFIVTPIVNPEVIKKTVAHGLPIFPGAYSPTEIYNAWSLGASAVKIFPASQLGVQYLRDVSAPLNEIKLLPTGGVTVDNINSFFKAGAFGVGMGSSLFDKKLIDQKDFEALKAHFQSIRHEIEEFIKS